LGAAIETQKLTKSYQSKSGGVVNVVDALDLYVEEGEIFGFLGPNGAGKTTTIKMLLNIIYPTSGEAKIFGQDVDDMSVHRFISYLPEKPYYYEHMTGLELLQFYGSLFGMGKRDPKYLQLMNRVGLGRDLGKTLSQYSKGMQQRVGLAQSLLNDPKLLFLDEPTGGLDPVAHREIRDLILSFREERKTVFISSHELSEVERICDRVAIINHGRIEKQVRLDDLLQGGRVEVIADGVAPAFADSVRAAKSDAIVSMANGRLIVDMPDGHDVNALLDGIRGAAGNVVSIVPRRTRLEDLFVETVTDGKGRPSAASGIAGPEPQR